MRNPPASTGWGRNCLRRDEARQGCVCVCVCVCIRNLIRVRQVSAIGATDRTSTTMSRPKSGRTGWPHVDDQSQLPTLFLFATPS